MNGDSERLGRVFRAEPEPVKPGDDCPSPQELFAAVTLDASPSRRREIIDHTSSCASCAADWRLACELSPVTVEAALTSPSSSPGVTSWERLAWLWRSPSFVGAAAALVVLVAVGIYSLRPGDEPVFRDPAGASIRSLTTSDEPLPRDRCLLRWSPGPEGSLYDLVVTTEQLVSVASFQELDATEALVPEPALRDLPEGTRLFWQLTVHTPDGNRFRTETFVTELR